MLNSNDTCVSCCLFCHWERTPHDRTHHKAPLPMARKIDLVGLKTKDSKKKYEAISNHAYKRSKEDSNNIHGYRADPKLKVHRIPTNTPQKELHQIDLQETIVSRIKKREEAI